jgi:hypothetical protein
MAAPVFTPSSPNNLTSSAQAGSAKRSLPTPGGNEAGGHRLTPMDRLFLAVIVSALVLLVFSSALLVDRSQLPVTLIERP